MALVLAVLVSFVVASPGTALAEGATTDPVVEETTGGDAPSTTTAPEEKSEPVEAAASEESAPTTAAPETTPDPAPAESDLRPAGAGGVLSSDETKAQQETLTASPSLEPGQVDVTQRTGVNGCQGALPTPGSGNTDKRLIGGSLVPGGTAVFEISYPVDPADVTGRTTFEILDCVFIGGEAILSYDISFVPNTANFIFSFTLNIPASAPIGSAYCNVAKTTAAPSAPQQSNRKAGPACFMIGGDLRVLKVDVSGASLAGATFSVTCVPPTVPAGTFLPPIVIEGVARNTYTGVIDDGLITIAGPQGTVCTITETIPPPGYELAIPATQTATIGVTQVTLTFVNRLATGSLVINKTTTGGTGTFTFVVNCSDDRFDQTVTIVNSGSQTISGIPTGTSCTVVENAAAGFTSSVTTGSSPVTIGSGNNIIGFTNVRNTGSLVINKTTTGGTGTFTFVVDCSDNSFDRTVTIVNTGSQTITGIPTGTTCTVVETPHPDFSSAITTGSSPISIGSGTTTVGFTNTALLPSLGIVKTADAASVSSGSPIGFTVTVSNGGPGTARNVTLNDPLPPAAGVSWSISPAYTGPGTCSIAGTAPTQTLSCAFGNIAPGGSVSVHVASATTSATSGTLVNTATASADNHPSVNATAQIVINRPGLSVTKVADATSVNSGSPIGFTVTVSNAGPGTATSVELNDPLPSGTGINWSISPARAGCAITGAVGAQVLACSFGDMAPGATASVHVVSATTASTSGTFTNTATASASNHGPVTAIANVVVNKPNLSITKTADAASVTSGSPIGFTVTVSNAGPGAATNLTVSDPLPSGVDISWSISPATAGCSITGTAPSQTLTCTVASLAAGASLSVHVVSNTTVNSVGTFNNVATTQAANHPAVSANATTAVVAPPVVQGVVVERAAPAVIAPAPVEPAPAPAVAVAAAAPATLPRTGSDPLSLMFAGLLLIATGFRFRRWSRRA